MGLLVAGGGALSGVHVHVALQVRNQAEGLTALGAAVARHAGVQLQGDGVGEGLEAQGTLVQGLRVALLVVEQGAGMAVGAAAQVAPVMGEGEKRGAVVSAANSQKVTSLLFACSVCLHGFLQGFRASYKLVLQV